jgi:phage-related protein
MANAAQLAIDVTTNASSVASGFDDVTSSARSMESAVEKVGKTADVAGSRLTGVADGADNLDSKAAQATGSLGALSSGFELVGAEKYAAGLQSAALATDFLSGVGAGLNLIMNAQGLANARAAVTSAHTVATTAQSAATKAAAAAQWAMNAAMAANPVGLVVLAVIALIAAFVIAYKKSETFRNIVQAVGRAGAAAIGWVVDKVGDLVDWVGSRAPGAFNRLREIAVTAFNVITAPQRLVIKLLGDLVGWARDKVPAAFATFRDKVKSAGDAVLAPFRALKDLIDSILDKISKIKLPDIDVPFLRTSTAGVGGAFSAPPVTIEGDTIVLRFEGNPTPAGAQLAAREVEKVLQRRDRRLGRVLPA